MKNIVLLSFLVISFLLEAQTTITYEDHCYKENVHYSYQLIEYADPGGVGEHQFWDFSSLNTLDNLQGQMSVEKYDLRKNLFPTGNISIQEFGNHFIFEGNEEQIVQLGYVSKDASVVLKYVKPAIKLKFPMYYADEFSGNVEMEYEFSGKVKKGQYTVKADGYGSIILPNNSTFNNALRVKSTTTYALENGGSQTQEFYRWYVQDVRFPIMVLQETTYTSGKGKVSSTTNAAYNNLVSKSGALNNGPNFTMRPNPAQTYFDVQFINPQNGMVDVSIFSVGGKLVDEIFGGELSKGSHTFNYRINKVELVPGIYFIKIKGKQIQFTQQIIIQQ